MYLGGYLHLTDKKIVGRRISAETWDTALQAFFEVVYIHQQCIKHSHRQTVALGDNTQQKVFGADVIVPQPLGFQSALIDNLLDNRREFFIHSYNK